MSKRYIIHLFTGSPDGASGYEDIKCEVCGMSAKVFMEKNHEGHRLTSETGALQSNTIKEYKRCKNEMQQYTVCADTLDIKCPRQREKIGM